MSLTYSKGVREFTISLLIGLGPVVLVDAFLIDKIGTIFQLDSRQSFYLFHFIYFSSPFIVWLVSLLTVKPIADLKLLKTTMYVFGGAFLIISLLQFYITINVLRPLLYLVSAISIVTVFTCVYRVYNNRLPYDWSRYMRLLIEFVSIMLVSCFVWVLYAEGNADIIERNNEKVDAGAIDTKNQKTGESGTDTTKYQETKILETVKFGSENSAIFSKRDSILCRKSRNEKVDEDFVKGLNSRWSVHVNYFIYKGIIVFLSAICVLIVLYFLYVAYDYKRHAEFKDLGVSDRYVQLTNGEYKKIVAEPFQESNELRHVKATILILVLLVIPIFYSSNSPKEIDKKPFLNLSIEFPEKPHLINGDPPSTHSDTSIVLEMSKHELDSMINKAFEKSSRQTKEKIRNISRYQSDTSWAYLNAIWEDQRDFLMRVKPGNLQNTIGYINERHKTDSMNLIINPLSRK